MMTKSYRVGGFTLLEVLLVIVILVALAAILLPQLGAIGEGAKIDTTGLLIKTLQGKLETFKLNIGRYPTTSEGLDALVDASELSDQDLAKKWRGPYIERSQLRDPWNNEIHYVQPGEHNEKGVDLASNGPDGDEGTDDDITNWEE
jgi:general secretion pathway protein G